MSVQAPTRLVRAGNLSVCALAQNVRKARISGPSSEPGKPPDSHVPAQQPAVCFSTACLRA